VAMKVFRVRPPTRKGGKRTSRWFRDNPYGGIAARILAASDRPCQVGGDRRPQGLRADQRGRRGRYPLPRPRYGPPRGTRIGSLMITVVPWPGALALEICPWCSSTIFLTVASPKPVPVRLVVK